MTELKYLKDIAKSLDGIYKELRKMNAQKEEQNQKFGKWVPISEDLPKEGESVIASTKYGVYPEARYTKEYGWEWAYEAGADYWRELEEVEAWMPLPELYKPQESKEG